ncbi:YbaB/EbfC family nucleoid-associated protein [Actinoplanes subglobosus]|uniref:YbaB/EbfC family nucleoid-associated protein n=1 Tax=Actinoplanes subglobosus TaxID=1547892 RepID=A0ABV8J3F8_9ACTN
MFDGFAGRDPDEIERLIDEWRGTIEDRTARARALEARLAQLSETARSPDGLVTVTVSAALDLTRLDLGEGIRQRAASVTAREIMATMRAARGALVSAVTVATAETVGTESAAGQAIISAYADCLAPAPPTVPASSGPSAVPGSSGPSGVPGSCGPSGVSGSCGPSGVSGSSGPSGVPASSGRAGPGVGGRA